jgi:SAM-dependent methyltransferase
LFGACAWAVLGATFLAQNAQPSRVVFLGFDDARPALALLSNVLPAELQSREPATLSSLWPQWTRNTDAEIRRRLAQGDEDSLVNLLLFGTSFTTRPRLTARQIETIMASSTDPAVSGAKLDAMTQARLNDLVRAVARPGGNERLVFAQKILPEGQAAAKAYLLHALGRMLKEHASYAQIIEQAERSPIPGAAFARRSALYRSRGLSSDTSLMPNFGVEESLKAMRLKGLLPKQIRRVAIVGPGLDFADKQEGNDFYPVQTVQPFAVVDSLLRLQLANEDDLRITTFDVSARVNAHLGNVRARSLKGQPSIVQLPLDATETWSDAFVRYWTVFGDRIGDAQPPVAVPPNGGDVKLRAIRVRPAFGANVTPVDLNIVLQRLELGTDETFDLIVGTNVFLYYNEFQQALAMTNIERMLRPGGVLLSNNALVELPSSRVRFVGSTTLEYSNRKDNGDTIVWYKCLE